MGIKEFFTYRRPDLVQPTGSTHSSRRPTGSSFDLERGSISSDRPIPGVPTTLSFSRIVSGEACFPCRVKDFMNYLRYIERDPENLQFYLWFRDYVRRFEALSEEEKALSPSWNHQSTPIIRIATRTESDSDSLTEKENLYVASNELSESQPFRKEVNEIKNAFLTSTTLELNLSHRDRTAAITALESTTHPSAFAPVLNTIETALRQQSHPNFIRYTLSNSNVGRNAAQRYGGIILLMLAVIGAILMTLGTVGTKLRVALPSVVFGAGLVMYLNGRREVCLVMWSSRIRDRLPWEGAEEIDSLDHQWNQNPETDLLVEKFSKRNMVTHLIGSVAWEKTIRDDHVRRYNTILVMQNLAVGVVMIGICALVLVFIPEGHLY